MESDLKISIDPFDVIKKMLRETSTHWAVGTFGALAEFSHDPSDRPEFEFSVTLLSVKTARGAIAIKSHPAMRLFPYEGLSSLEHGWTQGVLICLPDEEATLDNRTGLFEIGIDQDACWDSAARGVLFDLGLGVSHLNACIRTENENLSEQLQTLNGANLFDPDLNLLTTITDANPTRVFISKVARIEVYQAIPDAQGTTPSGPHTHLSEKLLSHRQSQAATIPVPAGWVPVCAFYPPNPVRDGDGNLRSFDGAAHQQFQDLFSRYGLTELIRIKETFLSAMNNQTGPASFKTPANKAERTTLRIAIRQYFHLNGASSLLSEWRDYFEPTGRQ